MREILFRGKTGDGKWIYGDYQRVVNFGDTVIQHCIVETKSKFDIIEIYKVIPESVAQFTGLIDKNGKKIFEGDTIRIFSSNWWCGYKNNQLEKEKCIVSYNERTACFDFFDGKFTMSFDEYLYHNSEKKYSLEVIEDIHDNPELLGE
jgi:uncharacterized phage protein (TIGR01671 family)